MNGTLNFTFTPLHERDVIAAPNRFAFGTTALVVTADTGSKFYIEAVSVSQNGFAHQREVFSASTKKEILAWFAGNAWNPGGSIARPVDWIKS